MIYTYLPTVIGPLLLAGEMEPMETLHLVAFPEGKGRREPEADWLRQDDALPKSRRQISEYFAGERREFSLNLAPSGTAFQERVWWELAKIPYGSTVSYGEMAERIERPTAVRAVGAANGRNPLPIVLPCHRVIGANGSLTGFGGGIDTKRRLLEMEGALGGAQRAMSLGG